MEQHLNFFHPEYSHLGKLLGLPLPADVADAILLTPLEETKLGVPPCPEFTHVTTDNASGGEKHKHANGKMVAMAATSGDKRARMNK